jgi:hypothetical protein
MTRQKQEEDKTRQDKTRHDMTRQTQEQDKTRQDKTRQDKTRQDKASSTKRQEKNTAWTLFSYVNGVERCGVVVRVIVLACRDRDKERFKGQELDLRLKGQRWGKVRVKIR